MDVTDAVMDIAKRRGYLYPSYEPYGGMAGFYDYGPLGAAMKKRFEDLWRHVFHTSAVASSEIKCPRVTPYEVLKASGHVDEFTDLVVRCEQGHPTRADHLIEGAGYEGTADALTAQEIDGYIESLGATCPVCNKAGFTKAAPLNLMFQTEIGPGSGRVGYLRPETAQGIFVDFPHLLRFHRGKLPFAGLQVGGSNRNEISPRQGMLRLREFHMMEAEVFFADTSGPFPAFEQYRNTTVTLVPGSDEVPVAMTLGDAVAKGIIANEALAYFLGLTHNFLRLAGLNMERVRFRQHLATEMAHYANDCWDAEFESGRYGWVECVGIADRGCYDLQQHALFSGKGTKHPVTGEDAMEPNRDFLVKVELDEPLVIEGERMVPNMGIMGRTLRQEAKPAAFAMEDQFLAKIRAAGIDEAIWPLGLDALQFKAETETLPGTDTTLTVGDHTVEVPGDAYQIEKGTWTISHVERIPRVIEPSFGVDRILSAILEHAYEKTEKNGEDYVRLNLSNHVAPVQVAILPLMGKPELEGPARNLEATLRRAGVLTDYDTAGNIGRRYARQDEVGTPVCITIDPETLEDNCVTIRDRTTTEQKRVHTLQLMQELGSRFQID